MVIKLSVGMAKESRKSRYNEFLHSWLKAAKLTAKK